MGVCGGLIIPRRPLSRQMELRVWAAACTCGARGDGYVLFVPLSGPHRRRRVPFCRRRAAPTFCWGLGRASADGKKSYIKAYGIAAIRS